MTQKKIIKNMFIRYFDYLSPRVTFYYKGYLSHSSILSGLLSIISIVFIILISVNYVLAIILKLEPNTYYFRSFIEDAGAFQFNTSSLFHFISNVKNVRGITTNEKFDFTTFNIIGAQTYIDNYLSEEKRYKIFGGDYWLYGYCDKKINTFKLDSLITYDFFEKGACIKKYYNSMEKKYYEIGDPNFVWPEIAYGSFNNHNKIYGIFIQRCKNITINEILGEGIQCKNDEEFEQYFNMEGSNVMHLYFINNYINVGDYETPNNQYFYRIETPLNNEQYSSNDINISPTLVKSHDGLFYDHIREDVSYMYDRNDVYIGTKNGKNIFISYCFFLKNIMEYYERTYKKIQDLISCIGGVNQTITIIALYLNFLYNKFVILSDTELLLHSSIHIEKKNQRDVMRQNKIKNKNKELEHDISIKEKKKNNERKEINKKVKIKNESTDISKSNININKVEKNVNNNSWDITKLNNLTINQEYFDGRKKRINFCKYIFYKLTCQKKYKHFQIYETFRTKIISEEHLIKNHLNIYKLLKITEKKRYLKRGSYQLKDLIRLV